MKWFDSRRKLKSIKLTKQYQIRLYGWWFLISIALIFLLGISSYWLFEEQWQGLLRQDPTRTLDYLFSKSRFIASLVLVCLFLVIGMTCLGIISAHRAAGFLISLQKAFEEVKNGNLQYRIHFRKEDQMTDLERSFNEMMDHVQKTT